jgi:hypothetical protein
VTVLLLVAVIVLSAVVFVLAGACVELFRDVRQLQEATQVMDSPIELPLGGVGEPPSAYGLPSVLDGAPVGLVLVLSDKCVTCRSVARSFEGTVPPGLHVLVEATDRRAADAWLLEHGLAADGDVIRFDEGGAVAAGLGLLVSPAAIVVRDGRIAGASTVPSSRRLREQLRGLKEERAASVELGPTRRHLNEEPGGVR